MRNEIVNVIMPQYSPLLPVLIFCTCLTHPVYVGSQLIQALPGLPYPPVPAMPYPHQQQWGRPLPIPPAVPNQLHPVLRMPSGTQFLGLLDDPHTNTGRKKLVNVKVHDVSPEQVAGILHGSLQGALTNLVNVVADKLEQQKLAQMVEIASQYVNLQKYLREPTPKPGVELEQFLAAMNNVPESLPEPSPTPIPSPKEMLRESMNIVHNRTRDFVQGLQRKTPAPVQVSPPVDEASPAISEPEAPLMDDLMARQASLDAGPQVPNTGSEFIPLPMKAPGIPALF